MKESICVATVTYGNRRHLLQKMIEGVSIQGITNLVIVNNGAHWNVNEIKRAFPELAIEVVDMGKNTGSAPGYAMAIKRACELKEFVWLLDDDVCPSANCLDNLLVAYKDALKTIPHHKLAVAAFRREQQPDVAQGVPYRYLNSRINSFHGFHILDIPFKIWKHTPWYNTRINYKTVVLNSVPYGGLFFHRSLIAQIGLPNTDFILYVDDSEFTYRITKSGGTILLVTNAVLDELEHSWNIKELYGNYFIGQLCGAGDFRAYYAMRNSVYFDVINMKRNALVFRINRMIYLMLLFFYAKLYGKMDRYKLLKKAIQDGLHGRLGINEKFRL